MSRAQMQFKTSNPDGVMFTLNITMSLADWKLLKEQLSGGSFPAWDLGVKINSMIQAASINIEDNDEGDE